MRTERKITVHVSADLLRRAQRSTGAGVTETVRQGLRIVAATAAFEGIRDLRGRVSFSVPLARLREDRK